MSCDVGEVTERLENAVLSGPKVKGSHPVIWTPELLKAFEECKASLFHATLLAHPDSSAPLARVTDSSNSGIGAALQQRKHDSWQPLALILQPFRHFTYVTVHSPTLLSLLLRHRLFTYVTWRTVHAYLLR